MSSQSTPLPTCNSFYLPNLTFDTSLCPPGSSSDEDEMTTSTSRDILGHTRELMEDDESLETPFGEPDDGTEKSLEDSNVPNVTECNAGADIEELIRQELKQEVYKSKQDRQPRSSRESRTFRFVHENMGKPLTKEETARDLVIALRDCAQAQSRALRDANFLHHDVSMNNIKIKMVDGKATGCLYDWDLCQDQCGVESKVSSDRMGTLQFSAIRLLLQPKNGPGPYVPNRNDIEESFYHILVWMALFKARHLLKGKELSFTGDNFVSGYDVKTGRRYLSPNSDKTILRKHDYDFFDDHWRVMIPGFRDILRILREIFRWRYRSEYAPTDLLHGDYEEADKKFFHIRKERALRRMEDSEWLSKVFDNVLTNSDW